MVPAAVGAIAPRCARPSVVVGSPTRTARGMSVGMMKEDVRGGNGRGEGEGEGERKRGRD